MPAASRRSRGQAQTTPRLSLTVQYLSAQPDLPARHKFRRWVAAALSHNANVTIRIVDDAEGREHNRSYRRKDYATNVLTFVYEEVPGTELAGDVILCAPVVAHEALEQGKSLEAHYAHLTVHGVLHMQGFDHETDADAEVMEAMEVALLERLGYGNPYTNVG